MRRILAPLCGLVLVGGCSTVPMQDQPMQKVQSSCDFAQMERIERARQPILLDRVWVNCPQLREKSSSS